MHFCNKTQLVYYSKKSRNCQHIFPIFRRNFIAANSQSKCTDMKDPAFVKKPCLFWNCDACFFICYSIVHLVPLFSVIQYFYNRSDWALHKISVKTNNPLLYLFSLISQSKLWVYCHIRTLYLPSRPLLRRWYLCRLPN